jgi:predicted ester cyclase
MTNDGETTLSLDEMKNLSRRLYIEVFGEGNLDAADEIIASDSVNHGPGTPPDVGTIFIKQQATVLRGAIPDLRVTLEDQLAERDRVASRWLGTGTNTGALHLPSGSVPPTGGPIAFSEIRIDRYDTGRIVESWFLPDRLTLWQQLGLVPSSGANPR